MILPEAHRPITDSAVIEELRAAEKTPGAITCHKARAQASAASLKAISPGWRLLSNLVSTGACERSP